MSASDEYETKILQSWFGKVTSTIPNDYFFATYKGTPGDGTVPAEPTGGSYARASIPNGTANWTVSGSQASNASAIRMATASADWGTIYGWGLHAGTSGGTPVVYGTLTTPVVIVSGQAPIVPTNALVINCD